MAHPHLSTGVYETDSLLPNWSYDILIVGVCHPYMPYVAESFSEHDGQTMDNYFWDLLPEIFSGQKLKCNPTAWTPFLQSEQIGVTNLILNTPAHKPFISLHASCLPPIYQAIPVSSELPEWNTDVILKIIRENKISAVFIVNMECPFPIEPEIEKIRAAASLNEIHFGRLDSPSIPSYLSPNENSHYYADLFSTWFDSLSPVIKVRVR